MDYSSILVVRNAKLRKHKQISHESSPGSNHTKNISESEIKEPKPVEKLTLLAK